MSSEGNPPDMNLLPDPPEGTPDLPEALETQPSRQNRSRIISTVLSPAIRLWLRSQLDQVEDLDFSIAAGDLQLLSGALDQVSVSASKAVYRGLHLSDLRLTSGEIRTNLRQVLRGKPLCLLQAFPLSGELRLSEADLNASLVSPLLGTAVIDFLLTLLPAEQLAPPVRLSAPQVTLATGQLTFAATLLPAIGDRVNVVIQTGLSVEQGNQLRLDPLCWSHSSTPLQPLESRTFDLGSQVSLRSLTLDRGKIVCHGKIMVTPE